MTTATKQVPLTTDAFVEEAFRVRQQRDDLLAALDVIAHAAEVGGISAGERKGLAMAAKIALAAIAKAEA